MDRVARVVVDWGTYSSSRARYTYAALLHVPGFKTLRYHSLLKAPRKLHGLSLKAPQRGKLAKERTPRAGNVYNAAPQDPQDGCLGSWDPSGGPRNPTGEFQFLAPFWDQLMLLAC